MKKTILLVMLFSVICLLVACSEKDIDLATGTPGTSEPDASTPETQAFTLNTTQQTSTPINTVSDSTPTDTPTDSTQTQPLTAPSDSPTPSVPVHQLSPAEKYLAETSVEDIFEYFYRATEVGTSNVFGFGSPEEISSFHLYRFAIIVSTKAIPDIDSNWYNENDKKFYIPLSDITDILDIHFDNYSFVPTEVGHDYHYFNEETSEFEEGALGFGSGAGKFAFVSATATDDFTIEVIITDELVPEGDVGPVPDILVRAKVDDNGVKFTYCGFMNNSK